MKLNSQQIEEIMDKLVPLISEPEDHDFFRDILWMKAESCTSAQFACFVNKLLKFKQ